MKKCIAILGAETEKAVKLVERLAMEPRRLLLMSSDTGKLNSLEEKLRAGRLPADIVGMSCQVDSSWEADIVLIATSAADEIALIPSIRDFVIQKIVVSVSHDQEDQNTLEDLQHTLPHSKVLKMVLPAAGSNRQSFIRGFDTEAVEEMESILYDSGFLVECEFVRRPDQIWK